ncbi:hypothetical protein QR680_016504 [Steinernema hermaphroditum]|uniref:Neurotransmitter-gated ion-channel ligand-binding domain-containing protein n=1 Tax=Steinernema hermaphroditum TaxID=289476 RepID=A0AA39LM33_9BILA|nr:hypothetical protein QR680_016504 [Steinernema hermaphroditum]
MLRIFVGVVLFTCSLVSSQSLANTSGPSSQLTKYLMWKHERNSPPDSLIEIKYEIELVHIVHIDELKQRMNALVYVVEEWKDHTLSWNPSKFGNITQTWLPIESVWIPDLIVFNMLEYQNLLENIRSPMLIHSSGRVVRSYPALYSIMCPISVASFPFDDQQCALEIASWGYGEDKLIISVTSNNHLPHYSPNEEWALKNVGIERTSFVHESTSVSEVRFVISVSRKPLHYVINLVLPSYIICALSVAGLFARFSTRHERQARTVHPRSNFNSYYGGLEFGGVGKVQFFLFNIIIVTSATIVTWPVMHIYGKGFRSRVPRPSPWLLKLFLLDKTTYQPVPMPSSLGISQEFQERQKLSELWSRIARRLDYLLSSFFLVLISIPTLSMFFQCAERIRAPEIVFLVSFCSVAFVIVGCNHRSRRLVSFRSTGAAKKGDAKGKTAANTQRDDKSAKSGKSGKRKRKRPPPGKPHGTAIVYSQPQVPENSQRSQKSEKNTERLKRSRRSVNVKETSNDTSAKQQKSLQSKHSSKSGKKSKRSKRSKRHAPDGMSPFEKSSLSKKSVKETSSGMSAEQQLKKARSHRSSSKSTTGKVESSKSTQSASVNKDPMTLGLEDWRLIEPSKQRKESNSTSKKKNSSKKKPSDAKESESTKSVKPYGAGDPSKANNPKSKRKVLQKDLEAKGQKLKESCKKLLKL